MRKATAAVAFLLLWPWLSQVCAQGEFPLEQMAVPNSTHPLVSTTAQSAYSQRGKPYFLWGPPARTEGKPLYFSYWIGQKRLAMARTVALTPRLFVDTDGDNDLSDEVALEAAGTLRTQGGSLALFGPIPIGATGVRGSIPLRFDFRPRARSTGLLICYPGFCRAGDVRLGGRTLRLALVDANMDGSYNGAFAGSFSWRSCDRLAIDLNGDGTFDTSPHGTGEHMPLPAMIGVGDSYYQLKVAPDGSAVNLTVVEPEFGLLDLGTANVEAILLSDNGHYRLESSGAALRLPVGNYMATRVNVSQFSKGYRWELSGVWNETGDLWDFPVRDGERLVLRPGPPLTLSARVEPRFGLDERTVGIGLLLRGQAGEEYDARIARGGEKLPVPKVQIVDESNNTLAFGTLDYRTAPGGWFLWRPPEGFNGRIEVRIQAPLKPFSVRVKNTRLTVENGRVVFPEPPAVEIPYSPGSIAVDGNAADWANIQPMPLPYHGRKRGSVRLCWQREGIYGLAAVADPVIRVAPLRPWAGDCLEVFIDKDFSWSRRRNKNSGQYTFMPAPHLGPGEGHMRITGFRQPYGAGIHEASGTTCAWAPTANGYVLEFFIPTRALRPVIMSAGYTFGLNFVLSNDGRARENFYSTKSFGGWACPMTWGVARFAQ